MTTTPQRIALALLLLLPLAARPAAAQDDGASAAQLIPVYGELFHDLGTMRRLLSQGEYDRPIQWLQDHVDEPGKLTFRIRRGHHVSIRNVARVVLAQMPDKALEQYHRVYDDRAAAMFEDAVKAHDRAALAEVLWRYAVTPAGRQAAASLGSIAFDAGDFAEAAWWWSFAAGLARGTEAEGEFTARAAAAAHLAGQSDLADALAARVGDDFADAKASWGGREWKLTDFVEHVRKVPSSPGHVADDGWHGWSAAGPGWARTQAVRSPALGEAAWCWPEKLTQYDPNANVLKSLAARLPVRRTYPVPQLATWRARLRTGYVDLSYTMGDKTKAVHLPSLLTPVVAGGKVIVRTDAGLVARRLDTGRAAWTADLPMEHRWKGTRYGISRLADEGWYQLAADGLRVYAVGDFLPTVMPPGSRPGQGRTPGPEETNSSTLACFSLEDGRELWKVGYGRKDNPEQLVDPKFGCPPLVAGDRLYALSLHERMQQFRLTCLASASGKVLWQRVICQSPPTAQNRGGRHVLTPGTSPAIFAGRVFACNNGGVVAALDAQNGDPIWLRQYDSGLVTEGRRTSGVGALKNRPVNPVVVAGLSVIALPVDSQHVLAFDLLDGSSRWRADRGKTDRLTGAGPGRVLLSGRGGWRLLRTFDGKQVAADADLAVWGIPAVTTEAAYLSARDGRVIRIDLASGKSRSIGTVARGTLGNLAVVDGKLVAASAAGVCVYPLASGSDDAGPVAPSP